MKTIKLIDLLVKIATGEDTPNVIKFNNRIFTHNGTGMNHNYYCGETDELLEENFILSELNEEVEVIEDTPKENKKIEKIELAEIYGVDYNDTKYVFAKRINEIIDHLNVEK